MKNLINLVFLLSVSIFSFSQNIKFVTANWSYLMTNNKDVTIEDYEKLLKSDDLNSSKGLNYYDIDLDKKTYIHGYLDDSRKNLVYDKAKIKEVISNEKYIKFEVKTKDFGVVKCIIPKNEKLGIQMVFSWYSSKYSSKMISFVKYDSYI